MAVSNINNKVLNKIKKALALAGNNPNQHEAQAAMAMAQRLMVENGLSMNDVDVNALNKEKEEPKNAHQRPVTDFMTLQFWHKSLSMIISDNFRCFCYISAPNREGKKRLIFLGLQEDTELAKEVFMFACRAIEYGYKRYLDSIDVPKEMRAGIKNEYIKGYCHGIHAKFKEQVEQNNWQIVLVKHEVVVSAYKDLGLTTSRASHVKGAHNAQGSAARAKGYSDGKQFDAGRKKIQ